MMLSNRGRRNYESTKPGAVVFVLIPGKGFVTAGTIVHPVSVRMNENKQIRCDQWMLLPDICDYV